MAAPDRRARRARGRTAYAPLPRSRAQRFAARMSGRDLPDFTALERPASWRVAVQDNRRDLMLLAALIHYRPAIDGELNGAELARLAQLVGEARFDDVCGLNLTDLPLSANDCDVPPMEALETIGQALLARAESDPAHARLAECAAALSAETAVTAEPSRA